ncbi:MAG: sulfatase-like hydrolase/transferase [Myxococcota bacterium]
MFAATRIRRGALLGALTGAIFFVADVSGALLAIGSLFDPKPASVVLVLIAGAVEIGVALTAGALLGALWTRRIALSVTPPVPLALVVFAVIVASGGYAIRRGRALPDPPPRPAVRAVRPVSVLWIVIDTLRADTLYGDAIDFPLTPELRRFADRALVFTDAESAAGWTIPSVATLLSGIHPTALYSARRFLPGWAPTAAERLHAAGYETRALVDNAIIERRNGFAQGFETFDQRSGFRFAFSLPGFRLLPSSVRELLREALPAAYQGSPGVTDAALEIIARAREAPLFLYIHYMDPHHPYYAHPSQGPEPADAESAAMHFLVQRLRNDSTDRPSAAQMRYIRHRYAGEIRALDDDLGRLLRAWDDTISADSFVLVTADHGEEFLDHGELGHGQSMYRELVHVPLIVRLPESQPGAFAPGTRLTTPVGQVDLVPTLLDIVGVAPQIGADGILPQGTSWLPWLDGKAPPPAQPIYGTSSHYGRRIYRWREGSWSRLITFDKRTGGGVKHELFDIDDDPREQSNRYDPSSPRVRAMSSRFEPFLDAQETARDPKPTDVAEFTEDHDALRALGYVQ